MIGTSTGTYRTIPGLLTAAICFATVTALGDVKPHALFSDGAVLQQEMSVPVWGTATDGEKVTVRFQGQELSTVAQDGRWMVRLKPMKPGGPFHMTITGNNTVEITNMMVGEVWICSGQSNMEFPVAQCTNAAEAMASSPDSMMRLFNVPKREMPPDRAGPIPQMTTRWTECEPGSVAKFSGVGYFFGRRLRETLKVPVGLIHISCGGSSIYLWMNSKTLTELAGGVEAHGNGWLYDSMVRQIQPYAIRGVIWYQGESDADNSLKYRKAFPALIKNWREDWQECSFPFLFVQLTSWNFWKADVSPEPQEQSTWAELREAQARTAATVSNTAMVVTTDLGSPKDVHPARKKEIGDRLAMAAEGMVYGKDTHYTSPEFKNMTVKGSQAVITFAHVKGELVTHGPAVCGFAIASEDRIFYNADAVVEGDKVTVSSPKVPSPAAVRYGWANCPLMNLFLSDGLPVAPFRTDDFPLLKCSKCKSVSGRGIKNGICNECGGPAEEYRLP